MAGIFDAIYAPSPRDVALGGLLGIDARALKVQALSNAAMQAGAGMLAASGPSPYPVGWGQGIGAALGGFGQGYRSSYNDALREGAAKTTLARAKRTGERETEQDRLRDAAILEAQTAGYPIPSRAAGAVMAGGPVDPNAPRTGLGIGGPGPTPATSPISASPLMQAIDTATGFGPRSVASVPLSVATGKPTTGFGRDGDHPLAVNTYPVPSHSVTMPSKVENTRGPGPGTRASNQRSASPGSAGLPPAMAAYLLHNNPATYANIMAAQNRPRTPQVRNFTIGNEMVPHQFDPVMGQWVALEGTGGPRFSPRYRGELTEAQKRDNDQIEMAWETLRDMGLTTPEAIKAATTEFLPTGRVNPRFQRGISRLVNRATTRKTGADDTYADRYSSIYGGRGGARSATRDRDGELEPPRSDRPARAPAALPMTGAGQIDRMRLKDGESYSLPDGRRVKWNAGRKGFEVIE